MNEKEVRQAIVKDFGNEAGQIASETNPHDKTAVLVVTVPELIPNAGPSQVAYTFGYRTRRLIQVNIVWSTAGRGITPESIVATGNILRDYFTGDASAPTEGRIVNAALPDGSIVLLRTVDEHKHMVLLLLTGAAPKDKPVEGAPHPPMVLQLSYILDPENPDIFRLKRGQF